MIIHTILSVSVVASLGVGLYLYSQNRELADDIAAGDKQCERQLERLESQYFNRFTAVMNELQKHPPERRVQGSGNHAREKQVDYNKLISYGHRVRAVSHKYEFLLASAQIDHEQRERLRQLLMQRERLASTIEQTTEHSETVVAADIGKLENTLHGVEEQIEFLLRDPVDYMRYQYLREKML